MTRIYDLVMTHHLDTDDFFIHRIQQHCAEAGLNFFLVEPLWVDRFFEAFKSGRVWARVLLNMHSEHHHPNDIFHRLLWLAAERHTQIIDPPGVALAAFDKARLHGRLIEAGLSVPPTIVVPHEEIPAFQLTDLHRDVLGTPFVVKPALGYGRKGVVLDATTESDLYRSAKVWRDANYLLQRKIVPRQLNGAPAYFRVYYVFGAVWLSWWNCYTDLYRPVTAEDTRHYSLTPLEEIVRRVAALTQMQFFSSEIALTDAGEFVLIDYVNDQCHLLSQTASPAIGVPDELIAGIARQLVNATRGLIQRN